MARRALEALARQADARAEAVASARTTGLNALLQRIVDRQTNAGRGDTEHEERPFASRRSRYETSHEAEMEEVDDADGSDASAARALRDARAFVCRQAIVPRVWTTDDEREAARRIREEIDAAIPGPMCAVCARRRPPGDVTTVPVGEVPSLPLLSVHGVSTAEYPREALTTVEFDGRGGYCMHPDGTCLLRSTRLTEAAYALLCGSIKYRY